METHTIHKGRKLFWVGLLIIVLGFYLPKPIMLLLSQKFRAANPVNYSKGVFRQDIPGLSLFDSEMHKLAHPFPWQSLPSMAENHIFIEVFVDTEHIAPLLHFEDDPSGRSGSIAISQTYPVYLFSRGNIRQILPVIYGQYIIARQEAKDRNGHWVPIEYAHSDWCGNSFSNLKLRPGEFLTTQIPVYDGTFETELRMTVFGWGISNTYRGKINESQLIYGEDAWFF